MPVRDLINYIENDSVVTPRLFTGPIKDSFFFALPMDEILHCITKNVIKVFEWCPITFSKGYSIWDPGGGIALTLLPRKKTPTSEFFISLFTVIKSTLSKDSLTWSPTEGLR